MTRGRRLEFFVVSSLLFGSLLAAQEQLPKTGYDVKPLVVKVEIHLKVSDDRERVPDQLKQCFEESDYCVMGTGVRLDGGVLTAAHVARDTGAVAQALRDVGVASEVMVAGQARNAEYVKGDLSGTGGAFRASIKAIDSRHDVALVEPDGMGPGPGGMDGRRSHRQGSGGLKLGTQRPTAGDAVFAFGFATYSPLLVTTNGSIVLAAGSKNLIEAHKNGDSELSPMYRAKLNLNPGNSGGPLFRSSDGALVGIIVEIGEETEPVATILPAAEIAKFLSANGIQWNAAANVGDGGRKRGRNKANAN